MSGFLALPREIRMTIFEYCLTFKNEIVPYVTYWEPDEGIPPFSETKGKHDLALFYVNRQISAEVPHVFFAQNTFRLSYVDSSRDAGLADRIETDFWRPRIHLFHHINLTFDFRDVHPRTLVNITKHYETSTRDKGDIDQDIQNDRYHQIYDAWDWKLHLLQKMRLKTLRMDFENLYGPSGLSRLFDNLVFAAEEDEPGFLVPWHRKCEAEACGWDEKPDSVYYSSVELQKRPPGLADMKIMVVGLLTGEKDMIHSVGFACDLCPLKGKRLDTSACLRGKIDPDLEKVVQ